MSTRQDRGPGRSRRDEVEEILCLVPGATTAEADALEALFADAAGPQHAGELAGEAAAVAAFRAARPPAPRKAGRARIVASLTTLLTFKTAAAALAVTSVGGLALAAGTGALPTPLTAGAHHSDTPARVVEDPGPTITEPPAALALRDAAKAAAAADRAYAQAGHDRSASYAGLCTAFTAGGWDNTRAATNPAFSRLVAIAPNGDVAGFCQALATAAPASENSAAHGNPDRQPKHVGKDNPPDKAAHHGNTAATPASKKSKAPAVRAKTADHGKVTPKHAAPGR